MTTPWKHHICLPNKKTGSHLFIRLGVLFLLLSVGSLLTFGPRNLVHAASSNPITSENQQTGTTGWQFDNFNKASHHEIEGYASSTSVNLGSQISFMVSLSASAQYTMNIYRIGYYFHGTNSDGSACTGCGGRLMQSVGPLQGTTQPACPTTASGTDFGLIECQWTSGYTLTIPTSWTTGNYIVKLKRLDDGLENYLTFVVRDNASSADIVYSLDVTTWQAYNYWGGVGNNDVGYDLYGEFNDVTQGVLGNTRAYTVSFDRPYMDQGSEDGAGNFMLWDYPMIHWMEEQGYNITYVTDVDLENNPNLFNGHKVFVNTGHDEYYSANMRTNLQNFINAGGNAAFFSGDDISRRMTWSNSITGQLDRREHCDKGALPGSITIDWRAQTPPLPENQMIGSLSDGAAASRPFLVYDSTSWIFAGTGLVNYNGTAITSGAGQNAIKGVIGYEFNTRAVNASSLSAYVSYEPPGLQQVGHSFVPASDNGVNSWADTTLYTSSGGGIVFTAGTIQWTWGVDNGFNDGFIDANPGYANTDSQIITANILNRQISGSAPMVALNASSLNFGNQNVGTSSAAQSVILTNTGTTTLTINSITLTGTNAGDFAETSTCPATLAVNANCTISVTFTPSANGTRTAMLNMSDNAVGNPQSVILNGSGGSSTPALSLIGSTTANGNFSAGVNLTLPAVQAGDLLIAVAGTNGTPASWTTPAGWNTGANAGQPDGQGLNWWWKIATSSDSGATLTLRASSYADGGGVVLDYRNAATTPIQAVSTLATNDNGGNGKVTAATFNGVSWSGSTPVASLLLLSWQPASATVSWPTGYNLQASATDGYGFVCVGANLTTQTTSSLGAQSATLSMSQAVVPTLQLAIFV